MTALVFASWREPGMGSVCWTRGLCAGLPIGTSPCVVLWHQIGIRCKTISPCWSVSFLYIDTSCGLWSWCDNSLDASTPALCHDDHEWTNGYVFTMMVITIWWMGLNQN